jgi:hypothetical protein
MADCWKVLGIPPGSDETILRQKWLELVKQHHPDRGRSPEQIRRRTNTTAQLNWAYDEAQRQIRAGVPAQSARSSNASPHRQEGRAGEPRKTAENPSARPQRQEGRTGGSPSTSPSRPSGFRWESILVPVFLVLLVLAVNAVGNYPGRVAGWVNSLAGWSPVGIGEDLATWGKGLLGAAMLVVLTVLLDLVVCFLAVAKILEWMDLDRFLFKVWWLAIVLLNPIVVAIFLGRPDREFDAGLRALLSWTPIAIIAWTVPAILFVSSHPKFPPCSQLIFPPPREHEESDDGAVSRTGDG